ncbi:MAG: hypothetical protein WCC10_10370 [Tumebacillaceae bacterium]
MRKAIVLAVAAGLLVLSGCSKPAETPQKPPAASEGDKQPQAGGSDADKQPQAAVEKTEDEIKQEITQKLARLTDPKGYALPTDSSGHVDGAVSVDDVTELLRKKGYSPDLAKLLAKEFYQAEGSGVKLIARDGAAGVFQPDAEATWTKKSKYVWSIEQKHPNDQLNGPHVANYEVEVLKDGTYRLNAWIVHMI